MNFVACRLVTKRKKHKVHTNYQQFVLNFCHLFLANGQVGVTPKSSILRRFSMKKTIHFGAPPVMATTILNASTQPHFADIWAAPLGPRRGFRWRDHAQAAAACSGRCPGTQIQDWQVPEGTRWPLSYHIHQTRTRSKEIKHADGSINLGKQENNRKTVKIHEFLNVY